MELRKPPKSATSTATTNDVQDIAVLWGRTTANLHTAWNVSIVAMCMEQTAPTYFNASVQNAAEVVKVFHSDGVISWRFKRSASC